MTNFKNFTGEMIRTSESETIQVFGLLEDGSFEGVIYFYSNGQGYDFQRFASRVTLDSLEYDLKPNAFDFLISENAKLS